MFDIEQGQEAQVMADFMAIGKQRMWLIQCGWGPTATRDYLTKNREDSLILEKKFIGVTVYLYDLSTP